MPLMVSPHLQWTLIQSCYIQLSPLNNSHCCRYHLSPNFPVSKLLKFYRAAPRVDHNNEVSSTHTSPLDVLITVKPKGKAAQIVFTSWDLRKLMTVICDVNPFMAEWGMRGKKWAEVSKRTRAVKACIGHSDAMIQHKVTTLLKY